LPKYTLLITRFLPFQSPVLATFFIWAQLSRL
jgi:hypothetical protein